MDKILAAGASISIRPNGSDLMRFSVAKYGVGVEYREFRNAVLGDDLEEIFARLYSWMCEVDFYSGSQWTDAQVIRMRA